MKNSNQQFFFKFLCQALLCKSKKIEPLLTGIKQNAGASKQSKIKIHNSKFSSNLDLPHSLVINVFLSSFNFCAGDIKHIKTNENKLDLEQSPSQPLLGSSLVTQRSSLLSGEERCVTSDDPNNGCEGDQISSAYFEHDGLYFVSRLSPRRANYPS